MTRVFFAALIALLWLFCANNHAAILTTAAGVYDEQATQLNQVDQSATTPTSGTISLITLAQFKTDLATAFPVGLGGVIHFDDVVGPLANQTAITASYAGGLKTLNISGTGFQMDMSALAAVGAQPISGNNYLRSNRSDGIQLYNFDTGLSAVGVTVLARNAARNITALVTYDDNTTGTIGPFAVNAASNPLSSTATPDTFFGFSAPTGKLISSLQLAAGTNNFFVIDDLAFITPIPEPSSVCLWGMSAIGLVGGWIKRNRRLHRGIC